MFTKIPEFFESNEKYKTHRDKHPTKTGTLPVKQKARPVPLHLQEDVGQDLEKLIKTGHLEKINDRDEDCFV